MPIWKIRSLYNQMLLLSLMLLIASPALAHDGHIHASALEKSVSWIGLLIVFVVGLVRIYQLRKSSESDDTEPDSSQTIID